MFMEGDRVQIIGKNVTGEIIDVYEASDGTIHYNVESDQKGPSPDPDAWNGMPYPQFDCLEEQLKTI